MKSFKIYSNIFFFGRYIKFCDPALIFLINLCDRSHKLIKNVDEITVLQTRSSQGEDNKIKYFRIMPIMCKKAF
ncbi:hypothetical protein RHAA1_07616 [Aggregatibacter actinomycetemcomitans RhAA1]|nr:hypothetical protein RHAA1_07616 [Aggregatibacter actinomycetemcomitans RhAA1]KNE77246.1 hypothetical protein RHAA2_07790 [Aggregatibacter actinomycetemcomitans RhAA1]